MPTKKITIRSLSSKMDQSVKRMLKLIEEDGDSFAKKAEMYYQKRPELISLVEEFYRIYRSLAERQDLLTLELRKSIPIDLQSQGSNYSDMGSELPSVWPSPDQRLSLSMSRRKSTPRAAGFEFFLGSSGGNGNISDAGQKDGDDSSSVTDSESECDDFPNNNYSSSVGNSCDQSLNRKIIELEIELRDVKNKLYAKEEQPKEEGKLRRVRSANSFDLDAKIAGYEDELKTAIERLETSKKEVARLKNDLQNYKSIDMLVDVKPDVESPEIESPDVESPDRSQELDTRKDNKSQALIEEVKISKENLRISKEEIVSLKCQLESAKKDISMWKIKLNSEKREVSRLQDKLASLKTSLSDRDHEVRNLKLELSDGGGGEISKLLGEQGRCEERVKEWESRGRSFEDEIKTIRNEKIEVERKLNDEIKKLKAEISGTGVVSDEVVSDRGWVTPREDRNNEIDQHMQDLHMEHAELNGLRENIKELEEEIERQKNLIFEAAEEKREAIRQLCFSLEHYRNGYHRLRRALIGQNKGSSVAESF